MKRPYFVRAILVAATLVLQLGALCLRSHGGAGAVDLSFDPGSGVNGPVNAIAVQPNGKVLIGGQFTTIKGFIRTNIARLNADGSGDNSFLALPMDYPVSSLALQSDGKVLVGSFGSLNDGPKVGLLRLNSDGSPDTNFNANAYEAIGLVAVDTIIVQPDGKVISSGRTSYGFTTPIRLNNNGTLDSNFVSAAVDDVNSMVLQPDGKLLVGGDSILRLNANGSIDNTFNSVPDGWAFPLVLQPDGKVLAGGGHVRRFNTNGSLDQTFQVNSVAYVELIRTLALQPDGKVVIGGTFVSVNGHSRTNLARLNSDGSMDLGFQNGTGGVSGQGVMYFGTSVRAIALQTNGTMLIGGAFTTVNGTNRNRMARLHGNGSLDTAFNPGQGLESPHSTLVVQPDDKVLVGGPFTFINGTNRYASARLNANGSRDQTFIAAPNFNPNLLAVKRYDDCPGGGYACQLSASPSTVAVLADGKVLIGGSVQTEVTGDETWVFYYRGILGRFYADGSLDTNFAPMFGGPTGVYDQYEGAGNPIVQPDGKILVSGTFTTINGTNRNGLARLNANGTLDLSFAPATGQYAIIASAALQPDGKVLIAGRLGYLNGVFPRGIARLNANGSFDNSFNSTITVTNGDPFQLPITSLGLQPDGKVLIGGSFTNVNGTNLTSIARLNANGSLDASFSPGTTAPLGVGAIALQSNGDVLITGNFLSINGVFRPHIARLYGDSITVPSLNISRSNAFVIVSWPVSSLNFQLQESTNLSLSNSWASVAQASVTNAGQISVTVPTSVGRKFFRLKSQSP